MSALRRVRPQAWGGVGLALLLLIIGLGGRGLRLDRERLSRVLQQERELRQMVAGVRAEQTWLETQFVRPLDEPQVLLNAYAPDERIRVLSLDSESLSETIRLRRGVLELDGVPWDRLQAVIHAFERQSPPWRMTRFEVQSVLTGLEGQLVFEGLERTQ